MIQRPNPPTRRSGDVPSRPLLRRSARLLPATLAALALCAGPALVACSTASPVAPPTAPRELPELEGERPLPGEEDRDVERVEPATPLEEEVADAVDPERVVPLDPAVRHGTLDNGLAYYVRRNDRPEDRAELRLVVNAGSLQESEDQRGLAHFVEHMAFNGTENFEKQELVDYLEGIGMRFGPDLNAYTSFDETVYMLQIPTDDAEIVATGLDILEDWAHRITFEDEEIDKERGVVVEEWRQRQGAGSRILDQQLPVTFHGSLYAERLPIGDPEILRNAPYEQFRSFYRDWYRPELMAVVAVGDFDPERMEQAIREQFGQIPARSDAPERSNAPIPDHERTLVSIVDDPEATSTRVTVGWKRPPFPPARSVEQLRRDLVDELYHTMMIGRLQELTQKADPPYQFAFAYDSGLGRTKSIYQLVISVRNAGVVRGLETVLLEAKRVREHGFTETELERGKTDFLRGVERAYEERENQESRSLVGGYVRHFLEGDPAPGIEFLHEVYDQLVPEISLDEINSRADQWMTGEDADSAAANRIILVSGPDSEEAALPGEGEILAVFAEIDDVETEPWVDQTRDDPLVPEAPTPGEITEEETIPHVDATRWTLSNGVEVYLKPTDFKDDEVLMASFSPGGHSLASDEEFFNASQASSVVRQMGLGSFSTIELGKKLTGKAVGVSASIDELYEGVSGSASPKDLETLFQLTHLSFTSPRHDQEAFESLKTRVAGFLENQKSSPGYWFNERRREELFGDHPRRQGLELEDLDRLDAQQALAFYQERFADASDFTFFFVGAFTLDEMRPLVERWLASLPSLDRDESWRDVEAYAGGEARSFSVEKGLEPKAQLQVTWFGDSEWSVERAAIASATGQALRIRLREVLREDLGGVYGVGVSAGISREPRPRYSSSLSFGSDPGRVDELLEAARAEIERFQEEGPPQEIVDKVKENWRRSRETSLEENRFWLSVLQSYVRDDLPWADFDRFEERLDLITVEAIRDATRELFDEERYVEGRLVPEPGVLEEATDGAGEETVEPEDEADADGEDGR